MPRIPAPPIAIGDRRELLVDDFLVEKLSGEARLQLHQPVPQEIVLKTDAPWEGNACGYPSVFQDGKLYRMYYHAGHYRHGGKPAETRPDHPWFLCYVESDDGIHWRRPELGLFEFDGSKKNNIILTPESVAAIKGDPAHTAVFKDANPDCPADARYKCVIVGKPHGLYVLKSADGIRFSVASDKPVITDGAFDSENLAFWDPVRKEYRAYWRIFTAGVADGTTWKPEGFRAIRTATSKDFLNWAGQADLRYVDSPTEHLYTNQIQPYYRAPHIFMGFPMRYTDRGWSESMMALPGLEERLARAKASPRYGTAITDGLFMTSRDGVLFHRWNEAFLRPGTAPAGLLGLRRQHDLLGHGRNGLGLGRRTERPLDLCLGELLAGRRRQRPASDAADRRLCFAAGSGPGRRVADQTAGVRRRQSDAQHVDVRRGKHPSRDPGRRGPSPSPVTPWPTARRSSATSWRGSCVGATEATCGRCPASRSGCGSCSRMPICTPSSSCPTSPTRCGPSLSVRVEPKE